MGLLIAAAALLLGYGTAYVASDEVSYLSRAGIEETRILTGRTPIDRLARDPKTAPTLRAQARLVLDVRAFAAKLGLQAGETFTSYSDVGRDTLLLVLTVSPKNCICPVTWHYPIAGRVPYKGFFNFEQARRMATDYTARGMEAFTYEMKGKIMTMAYHEVPPDVLENALEIIQSKASIKNIFDENNV